MTTQYTPIRRRWRHIRIAILLAATLGAPLESSWAEESEVVVRPVFGLLPSVTQLAAIKKYAADPIARAERAGRPATPRIAINQSTTLISLESVAICDRANGCPLLVFRDITQRPTLITSSYQNVTMIYRGAKTLLILKNSGPDRECLLPPTGRGKCHPIVSGGK